MFRLPKHRVEIRLNCVPGSNESTITHAIGASDSIASTAQSGITQQGQPSLQMSMTETSQAYQALSNVVKSAKDTEKAITQNSKG
jgi:hypothetical protein